MSDQDDKTDLPDRKPWRTPAVIEALVADSEAGANPSHTEGAFAYGS
ncbi:MAG: hypothetical protein ACTHJR_07105 [Sphingomonas sp.]